MIIFQPHGKRVESVEGRSLLEAASDAGISIRSICGGEGLCGKCRVIVREGRQNLSLPTEAEKRALSREDLDNGFRLACQTRILKKGLVLIEVPRESQVDRQRLLLKGLERRLGLNLRLKESAFA